MPSGALLQFFLLFFLAKVFLGVGFLFSSQLPRNGGGNYQSQQPLHLSDEFEEDLSLSETSLPTSPAGAEVTWRAYKKSTVVVNEIKRSVEAYMALPSTE